MSWGLQICASWEAALTAGDCGRRTWLFRSLGSTIPSALLSFAKTSFAGRDFSRTSHAASPDLVFSVYTLTGQLPCES